MYTIIDSEVVNVGKGSKLTRRVEIICDTEQDLPTAAEIAAGRYAVGSMAMIADTHEIRILNHAGEWV